MWNFKLSNWLRIVHCNGLSNGRVFSNGWMAHKLIDIREMSWLTGNHRFSSCLKSQLAMSHVAPQRKHAKKHLEASKREWIKIQFNQSIIALNQNRTQWTVTCISCCGDKATRISLIFFVFRKNFFVFYFQPKSWKNDNNNIWTATKQWQHKSQQ